MIIGKINNPTEYNPNDIFVFTPCRCGNCGQYLPYNFKGEIVPPLNSEDIDTFKNPGGYGWIDFVDIIIEGILWE